jgi:ATP-binding cassette subfamily F protein 3
MDKTIFDEISDAYPALNHTKIRNVLAAFLFTNDDVFKLIGDLSGGERGRVSLAKLMLSDANFLILDEPTNHLDITSKEILESAINSYTGTVLYVSHDRYFINRTATRILELDGEDLTGYIGNYDYYLEKKSEKQAGGAAENTGTDVSLNASDSVGKLDWQSKKAMQAKVRKLENDIKKTESAIEDLEKKISDIDEKMSDPSTASNSAKLNELVKERQEAEDKLGVCYLEWEKLSEERDSLD